MTGPGGLSVGNTVVRHPEGMEHQWTGPGGRSVGDSVLRHPEGMVHT